MLLVPLHPHHNRRLISELFATFKVGFKQSTLSSMPCYCHVFTVLCQDLFIETNKTKQWIHVSGSAVSPFNFLEQKYVFWIAPDCGKENFIWTWLHFIWVWRKAQSLKSWFLNHTGQGHRCIKQLFKCHIFILRYTCTLVVQSWVAWLLGYLYGYLITMMTNRGQISCLASINLAYKAYTDVHSQWQWMLWSWKKTNSGDLNSSGYKVYQHYCDKLFRHSKCLFITNF